MNDILVYISLSVLPCMVICKTTELTICCNTGLVTVYVTQMRSVITLNYWGRQCGTSLIILFFLASVTVLSYYQKQCCIARLIAKNSISTYDQFYIFWWICFCSCPLFSPDAEHLTSYCDWLHAGRIYTPLHRCCMPSSPVLLHIYCPCFSTFWHCNPYILQHFNGNVFTLVHIAILCIAFR